MHHTENVQPQQLTKLIFQVFRDSIANSIARAKDYLERQLPSIANDRYALSIVCYALAKAGSPMLSTALQMLESLAIIKGINIFSQEFSLHVITR